MHAFGGGESSPATKLMIESAGSGGPATSARLILG